MGQVAIAIGDIGLAYQTFKIAVSVNPSHAESYNNLGVLELKRGSFEQARSNFQVAERLAPHLHEPKCVHAFGHPLALSPPPSNTRLASPRLSLAHFR